MTTVHQLFQSLWQDYIQRLCPSAYKVHELLQEEAPLVNDHIALRTFNVAPLGIATLARPFLELGYQAGGHYQFERKKLVATHFEHADPLLPKVFISELKVEECSSALQTIVSELISHLDAKMFSTPEFLFSGRPWALSYGDYQTLAQESEYAAWLAAHGHGVNHFTVNVNQLTRFSEVAQINAYLQQSGFTINASGGEVKGSPQVLLEQSSTMADSVPVLFGADTHTVPGGFYEFAKRYVDNNGQLYSGFVEASADKIFESTDRQ